jgi:hypothetical protein
MEWGDGLRGPGAACLSILHLLLPTAGVFFHTIWPTFRAQKPGAGSVASPMLTETMPTSIFAQGYLGP